MLILQNLTSCPPPPPAPKSCGGNLQDTPPKSAPKRIGPNHVSRRVRGVIVQHNPSHRETLQSFVPCSTGCLTNADTHKREVCACAFFFSVKGLYRALGLCSTHGAAQSLGPEES